MEPGRAVSNRRNSNVSNILPVTTFRTIDLAGNKISGPLFSRFCAEQSVFFEGFSAPKCVHENQDRRFVYAYTGRARRPSSISCGLACWLWGGGGYSRSRLSSIATLPFFSTVMSR
jgi:hypothetical protein